METRWGFSCLVEGLESTMLFDVGGEGSVLLSNMGKLEIDLKSNLGIDYLDVFLSCFFYCLSYLLKNLLVFDNSIYNAAATDNASRRYREKAVSTADICTTVASLRTNSA